MRDKVQGKSKKPHASKAEPVKEDPKLTKPAIKKGQAKPAATVAPSQDLQCKLTNLSSRMALVLEELWGMFGKEVTDLNSFDERFKIHKCFLEVLDKSDGTFKFFDFKKFDFVRFRDGYIQALLNKTYTLFVFTIRKAKRTVPKPDSSERPTSCFFGYKTLLKEVTPYYCLNKWADLFRLQYFVNRSKFVKIPHILQRITELNKHNPYDLADQEVEIEAAEAILIEEADLAVVPTRRMDFNYCRVYCIETRMKLSHNLKPDAQPLPQEVDGMKVYRRRDMLKLYTRVQWRNKGRDIREGEEARKSIEITGWKTLEYFDEEQTVELKFQLNDDGTIPRNDYGNIEVMNGVPPGTTHINLKGIKFVMKKLEIDWVPAVTEFELRNGRFMPVLSGVVVHNKDYKMVLKEYNKRKEELEKREEGKEHQLMDKLWKDIFKTLYTKKYFKDKQS